MTEYEGPDTSKYPSAVEVRQWANGRRPGFLSEKGMIPQGVIIAWNRLHPDRPYIRGQSHHGTMVGYNERGCRCPRCFEAYQTNYKWRQLDRAEQMADELLGDSA